MSKPFDKLLLATHNKGKLAEFQAMFAPYGVEVVSAADLNLTAPEETETTFIGNALIKARAAVLASGLPVLADDSGLCVNALDGNPGVYTADWAGATRDYSAAMARVHNELGDAVDRSAYFIAVLVLVLPSGEHHVFEGRCSGNIVWPPRGMDGHGYDPFFVPQTEMRSFGEMTLDEKAKFSHRAQAFSALVAEIF